MDYVDCRGAAAIAGLKRGDVIFHFEVRDDNDEVVRGISVDQSLIAARSVTAHVTAFRQRGRGTARIDVPLKLMPLTGEHC